MKCTFVASSTYSYPSTSSDSLPGSMSSKDSAAGGCSSAPTSREPSVLLLFSPETLGHGGTCQPVVTPISYLQRSKHFSNGSQEAKTFLQTHPRPQKGLGLMYCRRPRSNSCCWLRPCCSQHPLPRQQTCSTTHKTIVASSTQAASCDRVHHSLGNLAYILEACVIQLDSGKRLGTTWEHRQEHPRPTGKPFFSPFPKSSPPPKRKANTMLISSREISHTFSPATDQGAKPIQHRSHGAEHLHTHAKAAAK